MPGFDQLAPTGAVEGFESSRAIPVLSQAKRLRLITESVGSNEKP